MIRAQHLQPSTLRKIATIAALLIPAAACSDNDPVANKDPSACPNDQVVCSDQCVDLRSNPDHCGVCDLPCNSTEVCSIGTCKDKCDLGLQNCSRACVNTYTDPDNCGTCKNACQPDKFCAVGTCTMACKNECHDICTDTTMDAFNCGQCGMRCEADQVCVSGSCRNICEWSKTCVSGCSIMSASYEFGSSNPNNPCEVCAPENESQWTPLPAGSPCGVGMVCSENRECIEPTSGCKIGDAYYSIGDPNPNNPCETCTSSNLAGWTGTENEGTVCGDGMFCSAEHVCIAGCFIDGSVIPIDTKLDSNPCKACSSASPTQWSDTANKGDPCGDGHFCDSGNECVDGCFIDGSVYALDAPKPDSECWACQSADRAGFTPRDIGSPCTKFETGACDGDGECVRSAQVSVISARWQNTCAIVSGRVKCWGYNNNSQLGDQTTLNRHAPIAVNALDLDSTALSTGNSHTCAIDTLGGVHCWGLNDYGQLGIGNKVNTALPTPIKDTESTFTAISSGNEHTCAITTKGGVKCWGANHAGQLGVGSTTPSAEPMDIVSPPPNITSIATGAWHTCAISDSKLWCWGQNSDSQIGTGESSTADVEAPREITALGSDVEAVALGWHHTCALTKDHQVKCWGGNSHGQIGNGTNNPSMTPITIYGLEATGIGAGQYHTCAITVSGGVMCWGANIYGQIGDGTAIDRNSPIPVVGITKNIIGITAGVEHTCALTKIGAKCWGINDRGQLGNDQSIDSLVPVDVAFNP